MNSPDNDKDENAETNLHLTVRRLQSAHNGNWALLWEEAQSPHKAHNTNTLPQTKTQQKKRTAQRVQTLADANEASRALHLLRDTQPNLTTPDTVPKLQALFPARQLPTPLPSAPPCATREEFYNNIHHTLQHFPKKAGTGPLATTYEHLHTILLHQETTQLYSDAIYDLHTNNAHEDTIALHLSGALTAKANTR